MITRLPKPLFFGLLGLAGCLAGWALGEPALKIFSPPNTGAPGSAGSAHAAPNLIFSNPVMRQVMDTRGAHTGSIMIGLLWHNDNDLDLHCVDPSGEEIYFGHKTSRSGGKLDIDCNVGPPYQNPGAEHIYWESGHFPTGTYKVFVKNYANHGGADPTAFEAEILAQDQHIPISGEIGRDQSSPVSTFTINGEGSGSVLATSEAPAHIDAASLLQVGMWGALLAIPLGAALVAGQNALQRRALFQPKQLAAVLIGGLLAGFVSGGAGQFFFASVTQKLGLSSSALFLGLGQTIGWALLGALLGLAMALFIPNLPRRYALLGGVVGGAIGGVVFVIAKQDAGEFIGRAVGAASLGFGIGVMIAVAESLAREAALIVHWAPTERSIINLGIKPVVLGSSPEADLYLPKEKGFPAITALVTFREGRIEIENKLSNSKHELRDGSKLKLGDLTVEVQAK